MLILYSLRRCAWGLLLLLLLGIKHQVEAQAPAWQSLISTNGTSYSEVTASVADASGTVYVSGYFRGSVSLGNTILTSAGEADLFIAKWQPQGNQFVWVQQYGGTGSEWPSAIAVSGTNIYLTGYFFGSPLHFGGTTLTDNGLLVNTAFVAKVTDAGAMALPSWAIKINANATSTEADQVVVIGTNVYVCGTFGGTAQFGSLVRTSGGAGDAYVAKLMDTGSSAGFGWVQQAGGLLDDHAFQLVGAGSNLFVAGTFQGSASLGNSILQTTGGTDVFVAKLADAGTSSAFVWAERIGQASTSGSSSTSIGALALAGPNVYLAGEFSQEITLGSLRLTAPFANNSNTFLAKLQDTGNMAMFQWAEQAGGAGGYTTSRALAVAGTNVYAAGNFSSSNAQFGNITLTNANPAGFSSDIFVTKLTDAGTKATFDWARQAGSSADGESASTLALQGTTVVVGGAAFPAAAFGGLRLTGAAGAKVGFWATLTDQVLTASAAPLKAENLVVYPNPAHTTATVRLPAMPGIATAVLTVYDALGQAMYTQPVALFATGTTTEVQLAGFLPGLYHLRVQAGGQQASRALVVE